MYTQLAEIPIPLSAAFADENVIQVVYSARDHQLNAKRTLHKIIPIKANTSVNFPFTEAGEIVAFTVSPSFNLRANLREVKQASSTRRFVEIWLGNRNYVSFEVTDYHQGFYSDEYLSTLAFSPSESALLYTAEANTSANSSDDPYAKFRFKPSLGEGFTGKKEPRFFLLRWASPGPSFPDAAEPRLYEIQPQPNNILFGQGAFSPIDVSERTIYATGYELFRKSMVLGIKGCFNRPSGIWELQLDDETIGDNQGEKKRDISILSSRKITDQNSSRSPRVVKEGSNIVLYWFTSNPGGPHISTTSLHSCDLASTSENVTKSIRTVVGIPETSQSKAGFPGLYPPYNLVRQPILHNSKLIIQSEWHSRTTILCVSLSTGAILELTPPDEALYSWSLLATDGKDRMICSRSSPAVPYEILLGELSENGDLHWIILDKPDLSLEVKHALQSIRTSIHPIPKRHPTETIVIKSSFAQEGKISPLVTVPHGGPHASTTTAFSPSTTALALEGYTLSMPNYTGSIGYGQDEVYKLLGKCGTLDVEDVHASTMHVVNDLQLGQTGKGNIFVMGGSHGGFIAAHLISRYPDVYSAAVLRNPVITCGQIAGTDIPDWYFGEFGFQSDFPIKSSPPSSDLHFSSEDVRSTSLPNPHLTPSVYESLYEASPSTAFVKFLKARAESSEYPGLPPVLLLIGASDQRVTPTQGIGFYHLLKGAGEEVEMLIFDGEGHPLEGVEAAKVNWEAGRDWLKKFGRKD